MCLADQRDDIFKLWSNFWKTAGGVVVKPVSDECIGFLNSYGRKRHFEDDTFKLLWSNFWKMSGGVASMPVSDDFLYLLLLAFWIALVSVMCLVEMFRRWHLCDNQTFDRLSEPLSYCTRKETKQTIEAVTAEELWSCCVKCKGQYFKRVLVHFRKTLW